MLRTTITTLGVLLASCAQSAPIPVTNPGFEDIAGESQTNEFTFGPLNGWDLYDPNGITGGGMGGTYFIGTLTPFEPDPIGEPGVFANFPAGAAVGQRVGIAFNFARSAGQGEYGFEQILTDTLQPNTLYTLQVEIGNITSATAMSGQFFPLEGFPGYRVDLFTRGPGDVRENLDSDENTLAGAIVDGEFGTSTITIATGAEHQQLGEEIGIRLVNLNQVDPAFPLSDIEVDFDDVRLDATLLTPGDFNADGNVDGVDFLLWQNGFPTTFDELDLANWTNSYASVPALGTLQSVPEPTTSMIVLFAVSLCAANSSRQLCWRSSRQES